MASRGERMKAQRLARKIPRSAIARYMQFEPNTLYRWESGWTEMPKYAELCYLSYFEKYNKQPVEEKTVGEKIMKESGQQMQKNPLSVSSLDSCQFTEKGRRSVEMLPMKAAYSSFLEGIVRANPDLVNSIDGLMGRIMDIINDWIAQQEGCK